MHQFVVLHMRFQSHRGSQKPIVRFAELGPEMAKPLCVNCYGAGKMVL